MGEYESGDNDFLPGNQVTRMTDVAGLDALAKLEPVARRVRHVVDVRDRTTGGIPRRGTRARLVRKRCRDRTEAATGLIDLPPARDQVLHETDRKYKADGLELR